MLYYARGHPQMQLDHWPTTCAFAAPDYSLPSPRSRPQLMHYTTVGDRPNWTAAPCHLDRN